MEKGKHHKKKCSAAKMTTGIASFLFRYFSAAVDMTLYTSDGINKFRFATIPEESLHLNDP